MFTKLTAAFLAVCMATFARADDIKLENEFATWLISPTGYNLSLVDKQAGKERCALPGKRNLCTLRKNGAAHVPSACTFADGKMTLKFEKAATTVVLKAICKKHYFVFEIESISSPGVDSIVLGNLAVTSGKYVSGMSCVAADDEFAVAIRPANLQMLASVGGRPVTLSAVCSSKHGLIGAKMAVAACPAGQVRTVLKEIVKSEGLPYSLLGGPFALDAQENRGSYTFASVSEKNVDDWIAMAKRAGITTIHLNGWARSLGHYEPRKNLFPRGLESLKAVVDKIHAAGLKAGMHTLTGCISPHDPWVTPVPDRRLAVDASFTLAAPIDEKQQTVLTVEQPDEFDTVWAYASRGNVVRVDDELIQFSGLSREPPYGFTKCKRGAFGTRPSSHKKGATVDHLFRHYDFHPDENSTLVDEVADAIANVYNTCGFDQIYMDGAEGMPGGWHGVAKMSKAIFTRLKRPALVEASNWGQPSWVFHSRIGAWDYPNWALKRFVDLHCRATEQYRKTTLMPAQLGWWAIFGPNANRDAELPDEVEYLCSKALAIDAPMSFQALAPSKNPPNGRQDEYLTMIGRYERLRLAGYFSKELRAALRKEKDEFRLVRAADGVWQFIPTDYMTHKITALDNGTNAWTVENRFATQPVKLRIQALYSVEPYESTESVVLADFTKPDQFNTKSAAPGVSGKLDNSTDQAKVGSLSGRYSATSKAASRHGAWAKAAKLFEPDVDMSKQGAIGVWIHGDGKGELLNLQLKCPRQYWHATGEHYVKIDFTGWRYFELLLRERDAEQFGDYKWPYGGHYAVYRSPVIRGHISELNLFFNNLPPGGSVTCLLSPIKALRTVKIKLENPSVEIAGRRIVFPVVLESGAYLEFASMSDCKLYDARGALVKDVQPQGDVPVLTAGSSQVKFTCKGPDGLRGRAKVTVIGSGPPLRGCAPKDQVRWELLKTLGNPDIQ